MISAAAARPPTEGRSHDDGQGSARLYTTSPGAVLSKTGFTFVELLPGVALTVVCALYIADEPGGGWLIPPPAALLFGGACDDAWLAWQALRALADSEIKDGLRIYLPG